MLSSIIDSALTRTAKFFSRERMPAVATISFRQVETSVGNVRLYDSAPNDADDDASKPCVVFVPDGPNVIEHHAALFALLTPHLRVVCFDMPGFGFSLPSASYGHGLNQGAAAVIGVLDALAISKAWLAFSCGNGFYAMRTAQLAPDRVAGLFLTQTPALSVMAPWTRRILPRVLRTPVLGQILVWLTRKKLAHGWYHISLPRNTDASTYQTTANDALTAGGSFCLAGITQGLAREIDTPMNGIRAPCTLLWGEKDHSHKHIDPTSLLKDIPHAEIIRFADCGHFSDLEQPARYAELLLARIGGLSNGVSPAPTGGVV